MPINFLDVPVEGTAHHVPHHHLDALGSRLAHVLGVRELRESDGVLGHAVEKCAIEFTIDKPRALALELVRHAAGAVDDDAQILIERIDGAANGLAEFETTRAGGWGILHHVHTQRYHGKWPGSRLTAGNGQWHGQAVIHRHRIRDRHIEFVEDQRFGEMPCKRGMALNRRHRPRSETLVGNRKLCGNPDEEGRNDLQRKRVRVIVVDNDGDVGRRGSEPGARRFVASKQRVPIGCPGDTAIHRHADGRNVGAGNARNDFSHGSPP